MEVLNREIPARLDAIEELARSVEQALGGHGELAFAANLCLEELITNTVLHGLRRAPHHVIHIQIDLSERLLEIRIKDDAPPFDPFGSAPRPNLDLGVAERPLGGLGVHLVKSLMDGVHSEYDGTGNLTVLTKALPAPGSREGGSQVRSESDQAGALP